MENLKLLQRYNHVALEWNDCILVWGGWDEADRPCDPSEVAILCNGKWQRKKTSGQVPVTVTSIAHIVGDQMYTVKVIYDNDGPTAIIKVLDLTTWVWTRLKPEGYPPLPCHNSSSWVHDSRIYIFGGYWKSSNVQTIHYPSGIQVKELKQGCKLTNQLFFYDTTTNRFERQMVRSGGHVPKPRIGHSSVVHRNKVLSFGGLNSEEIPYHDSSPINELLLLDMDCMEFSLIHGNSKSAGLPNKRMYHSMTMINDDRAVLYGGSLGRNITRPRVGSSAPGDCWILDVGKSLRAVRGDIADPTTLWKKSNISNPTIPWMVGKEPSFCNAEQSKEKMSKYNGNVVINVGGTIFQTSRATLMREPDSVVAKLATETKQYCSDNIRWLYTHQGNYFIDWDPEDFELILKYLTTGTLPEYLSRDDIYTVKYAAKRFGLEGPLKILRQRGQIQISDFTKRSHHAAVLEPRTRRLYIIGGLEPEPDDVLADKSLVMTFNPAPLHLLAMEDVIRRYGPEDKRLEEFVPKGHDMRKKMDARRETSRSELRLHMGKW